MADIVVNTAQVSLVDPSNSELHPMLPDVQLARGDVTYLKSNGKAAKSTSAAAPTTKAPGIALESASVRSGVTILKRGRVNGFAVSGLAYGALVYLSDTAGKLADAAGTVPVVVGKVVPMSDTDLTKVLYVDCNWLT